MDERDERERLRDLEARLESARGSQRRVRPRGRGTGSGDERDGLAVGFRIGLELVTAVVVGTGIGWAFDRLLGTRPLGMILFFLLGVGAGMVNVYRALMSTTGAVGFKRSAGAAGSDETDEEED